MGTRKKLGEKQLAERGEVRPFDPNAKFILIDFRQPVKPKKPKKRRGSRK